MSKHDRHLLTTYLCSVLATNRISFSTVSDLCYGFSTKDSTSISSCFSSKSWSSPSSKLMYIQNNTLLAYSGLKYFSLL